jgi:hypothetical protein
MTRPAKQTCFRSFTLIGAMVAAIAATATIATLGTALPASAMLLG